MIESSSPELCQFEDESEVVEGFENNDPLLSDWGKPTIESKEGEVGIDPLRSRSSTLFSLEREEGEDWFEDTTSSTSSNGLKDDSLLVELLSDTPLLIMEPTLSLDEPYKSKIIDSVLSPVLTNSSPVTLLHLEEVNTFELLDCKLLGLLKVEGEEKFERRIVGSKIELFEFFDLSISESDTSEKCELYNSGFEEDWE